MNSLFYWILAIRPKTLIASISPVFIGTAMALSDKHFHFWVFLCTLLTGIGIQISTNVANDLFDFLKGTDTPERKGPVRVTQSGLLSVTQVKQGLTVLFLATTLLGIGLIARGGWVFAVLMSLALACTLLYTAGPFSIAYLGLAEFFVLFFFGSVATGCTYYLQTLHFSPLPFLVGFCPGLIACAVLIMNNLRDEEQDRRAKKNTLIVRFGKTFGKWEYMLSLLLPIILANVICKKHFLVHSTLLSLLPAIALIQGVFQATTPEELALLLPKTAQFFALFTFLFCLGWML